jgi:Flp pilus assembly protein TadG
LSLSEVSVNAILLHGSNGDVRCRTARSRLRRWAATSVEFAFVAPVFFLVVLGLIELGRGLMVKHLLANAARQGCRVGIIEGKSNADINAAVTGVLAPLGIASDTVTVDVNDVPGDAINGTAFNELTVIVSVPVSAVTWVPGGTYLSGSLSAQYTLRKE